MSDNRYQHQTFLVRCYRWLRWRPLHMAKAIISIALREHKGWRAKDVISLHMGLSDMEMEWTYTHEEMMLNAED